jgi:16S rRNA (guanine966-N2)-methyltransferase
MRIIAGKYRGRKLETPSDMDVRPTTDKMRERVFSMLQHARYPALQGANVLDVFAGTGALGLEALSRGASHITFVEKSPKSIALLNKNICAMKVAGNVTLIKSRATSLQAAPAACDIIFMDPPYGHGLLAPSIACLLEGGWLADGGVIVAEMKSDENFEMPTGLAMIDERKQGIQRVVFLSRG